MHNNDITLSTRVWHTDGAEYTLHAVGSSGGEVTTLNIIKIGFGHCFLGSPAQAREQGFRFGEETIEDIESLLTPEEPTPSAMRQAWLACEDANRDLTAQVDSLKADLTGATATLSDLRGEARETDRLLTNAQQALSDFKERVRDQVIEARKEHDLCIDGCNSFLDELGLPNIKRKWDVEVTRDSDGATIATISGVEAEDEREARDVVSNDFTVTATVQRIDYDYEYEGEGEADFSEDQYTDSRVEEDDDEYAESHKDALSFSASEA